MVLETESTFTEVLKKYMSCKVVKEDCSAQTWDKES